MLIQLGSFPFQIKTAAYHRLTRQTQANWTRLPILNGHEHLHATGIGNEVIQLEGTVYPEYAVKMGGKGGTFTIDGLRTYCKSLKPYRITAADGSTWGFWVIESITNQDSRWLSDGTPRKQDFQIQLRYYGETDTG